MTATEGEKLLEVTKEGIHVSFDSIRREMNSLGNKVEEYLEKVGANIETYKFSVDRRGEEIEVDVQFKAFILPKGSIEK